jgi:transposase
MGAGHRPPPKLLHGAADNYADTGGPPDFDDLENWLRAQLPRLFGKSPLAKAIRYALNRMPKTRPYPDSGFLELDNNTSERAMKPVTIGRKN